MKAVVTYHKNGAVEHIYNVDENNLCQGDNCWYLEDGTLISATRWVDGEEVEKLYEREDILFLN